MNAPYCTVKSGIVSGRFLINVNRQCMIQADPLPEARGGENVPDNSSQDKPLLTPFLLS